MVARASHARARPSSQVDPPTPRGRLRRTRGWAHYAEAVIEIDDVPELRSPILIAAFEGWNDAADAASSVVDHLAQVWDARLVAAIDPEDFYDFQVNRPSVGTGDDGMRRITWPSTQLSVCSPPGRCAT